MKKKVSTQTGEPQPASNPQPFKKSLPKYFRDRIVPSLDESKLSQKELAWRKTVTAQAKELKTWATAQIKLMDVVRKTPPSKNLRCRQLIAS